MAQEWTSVLARLGMPTGDGRILVPDGMRSRDLPLPLSWQRTNEEGHTGSVVVGRIESMGATHDMVTAKGTMLDVPEAAEAMKLITAGVIGPSVDLDDMTYVVDEDDRMIVTDYRVAGATLVSIPAFAEVSITMGTEPEPHPGDGEEPLPHPESILAAASSTLPAPMEWFTNPRLGQPTPLTVTEDGRVFGHIAPWNVCLVGPEECKTAPSSPSGYAYFLTHEQATDAGTIPVGVLTVGGGHAPHGGGFMAAVAHYDDVGAAVAHVNVGEDEHGIWAAGMLLPYADETKTQQFRTSPISGDWRRIGGAMEMIAVCAVNSPGFPIPRARAQASMSLGHAQSLVMALGSVVEGVITEGRENLGLPVSTRTQAQAKWAWTNRQGR